MPSNVPEYHSRFEEYSKKYRHVAMTRHEETGVLELRLHACDDPGSPLMWGDGPHTELGYVFADVGSDPRNRVIVLTGTGDAFCSDIDGSWSGTPLDSWKWDKIYQHGKRLLMNLLSIEAPVIAAVNGPATVHAELAVLSDIVICTEDTVFQDAPHFQYGVVPGDGVQVVWQTLLGPNRGRYFLLTSETIDSAEAKRLGVVQEVLSRDRLVPRAHELARMLAQKPNMALRYARDVLTQRIKRQVAEAVPYGLALEGLASWDFWNEMPEGTKAEESSFDAIRPRSEGSKK